MAKEVEHILLKAELNNNCPECFATDGLELTFTQKEKLTKWYRKASPEIGEQLICHTCGTTLYPIRWTEDIERVYQYHKKRIRPLSSKMRLRLFLKK
ncbi:hypothetical protein MG296_05760 [Flavobacteriaceae bacterium TK19130]|nr:hypothetical protein [Thermobacterium salinum]